MNLFCNDVIKQNGHYSGGTLNYNAMESPEISNISARLEELEHESPCFPHGMNIKCNDMRHMVTFGRFSGEKLQNELEVDAKPDVKRNQM